MLRSASSRLLLLSAALLLCVAALLFGSGALAPWVEGRGLSRDVQQAATDLDDELTRLRFFPRVLADDPRLEAALIERSPANILAANQTLSAISAESGAAFSFLMDPNGLTVASSNYNSEQSFIGRNYAFRPYFTSALSDGEGTFYAVGATTGVPGYFLARAMTGDTGDVLGVVVVKLDLESFITRASDTDRRLMVADDLGVVILSTEPDLLYAALDPLSAEAEALADEQRRYGINTGAGIEQAGRWLRSRAGDFLTARASSQVERWSVLALTPRRTVFNRTLGFMAIGGAALAILVLGLLLLRLQLRYSSQLRDEVAVKSQQLEAAQRQLIAEENLSFIGRMSAAISHEINQPLSSLRFNLAALGKLHDRDDEVQTIVGQSKSTASRIARVIETLRLFARRKDVEPTRLDLRDVATAALEAMQQERPRASSAIRLELPDFPARVKANDVLMQQVMINLLTNALDATSALEAADVRLIITVPGSEVRMAVQDNGPGVAAEVADDLFTPFASGKPIYKGLGLGLSLARTIVEDCGGTLRYAPQDNPFVSQFVVELPAYA